MGEFSQFRHLECIWQIQSLLEFDRASADFFSLHKKLSLDQKLADAIGLIHHFQARLNPLLNRLNRLSDSDKPLLSRSVLHRLAFSNHHSSRHLAAAMADFKLQFGVYASLSSSVEEVENLCRSRDLIKRPDRHLCPNTNPLLTLLTN